MSLTNHAAKSTLSSNSYDGASTSSFTPPSGPPLETPLLPIETIPSSSSSSLSGPKGIKLKLKLSGTPSIAAGNATATEDFRPSSTPSHSKKRKRIPSQPSLPQDGPPLNASWEPSAYDSQIFSQSSDGMSQLDNLSRDQQIEEEKDSFEEETKRFDGFSTMPSLSSLTSLNDEEDENEDENEKEGGLNEVKKRRLHSQASNDTSGYETQRRKSPMTEAKRRKEAGRWIPVPKPFEEVLQKLIEGILKKDVYGFFRQPVDPKEVPDYYHVISEPMDLGTMRQKVQQNLYPTLQSFEVFFFFLLFFLIQSEEKTQLDGFLRMIWEELYKMPKHLMIRLQNIGKKQND